MLYEARAVGFDLFPFDLAQVNAREENDWFLNVNYSVFGTNDDLLLTSDNAFFWTHGFDNKSNQ